MGPERFCALVAQALGQEAVGVEYLRALPPVETAVGPAAASTPRARLHLLGPTQHEVERDLAAYEAYVANGAALVGRLSGPDSLGTSLVADGAAR